MVMLIPALIILTLLGSLLFARVIYRLGLIRIPDPARRIGCIDGLRGYLALAVVIHHMFIWLYFIKVHVWKAPPGNFIANLGPTAVAVFFMITAVLFYPKMLRRLSDREWIAFFISRLFRLTPLLWIASIAVAAVVLLQDRVPLLFTRESGFRPMLQWLSFYGTPDLFGYPHTDRIVANVTWSLSYEWGFYLCIPAVAYLRAFLAGRMRPATFLFGLFAYFEWVIYRHYVGPRYYILFVAGLLVAEAIRNPRMVILLRSPWAAAVGLIALFSELFFCPTAFGAFPPILLAIFFAPVAAGNSYFKILSQPGSIVLGEVSYGIYLLHGIVLYLTFNFVTLPSQFLLMPLLAVAVISGAGLAHALIEAPAIGLGHRLAKSIQNSTNSSLLSHPADTRSVQAINVPLRRPVP
jgi:peptidoglycan/LPS O-acetylase OafA/YrhL